MQQNYLQTRVKSKQMKKRGQYINTENMPQQRVKIDRKLVNSHDFNAVNSGKSPASIGLFT